MNEITPLGSCPVEMGHRHEVPVVVSVQLDFRITPSPSATCDHIRSVNVIEVTGEVTAPTRGPHWFSHGAYPFALSDWSFRSGHYYDPLKDDFERGYRQH